MRCPSCDAPIPEVITDAPYCPYCGERKPTPRAPNEARNDPPFLASTYDTAIDFDPRVGYVLVGAHRPNDGTPSVRAYDPVGKRVLWEAFAGEAGVDDARWNRVRVSKGAVYVGLQRSLRALDLASGRMKWGAELSDVLSDQSSPYETRGMRIVDPAPPGVRGCVWAVAVDDSVHCFDRDAGQLLFKQEMDPMPRRFLPYDGGLLVLEVGSSVKLVEPTTRQEIDVVEGRIRRFDVEGRHVFFQVRSFGWRERDGVLVREMASKKETFFEAVENLEDEVPFVSAPGRVFCAAEDGAKLVATPHTKIVELVSGFVIRQLAMCGPTLFALLVKLHGTHTRRIVGVDPQTLAVRFDLGEMTTEPNDDWTSQMRSNGHVLAYVTSPKDDDDDCEIVAVDGSGRVGWRARVGEWKAHWFAGGNLIVVSAGSTRALRPQDGATIFEHHGR